jgi:glycoprotein-N-acetylgalactosamine 3-beta-galactosyltransferase
VVLFLKLNLDLIFRLNWQPPYFGEDEALNATIPISASSVDGTYADDIHPIRILEMSVNPSSTQRLKPFNYTNHLLSQKKSKRYDYNTLCPLTKEGIEGVDGHKVLDKIKRGVLRSRDFLKYQQQAIHQNRPLPFLSGDNEMATVTNLTATLTIGIKNMTARAKKSRILCIIYTAHFPPYYDNPNLRAQAETWGAQCDGFFAASNVTDHSVGSIDLYHKGKEAYSNMWQKIRSIWAYTHDHYREEFDFFHIGGDDIYVVMENLRAYLDGPEVTRLENGYQDEFPASPWEPEMGPRPLLLGSPMPHKRNSIVIAGGPGYTLNRAAMDLLVEQLPTFLPDAVDSREDVFVGSILKISNTRDSKLYVRYGGSAEAMSHFNGIGPESPKRVAAMLKLPPIPLGIDGVSEQFIAFHLKDDKEMLQEKNLTVADQIYRYHTFFHDWCNNSEVFINILVSKLR